VLPRSSVNVRLPVDLHERLVQLAAKEYRSLNRQMLVLVQEALAERQRRQSDEERETPYYGVARQAVAHLGSAGPRKV
jgi:hypothetical protein